MGAHWLGDPLAIRLGTPQSGFGHIIVFGLVQVSSQGLRQTALSESLGRELRAMTDYNKSLSALQRVTGSTLTTARVELKPAMIAQK